MARGKGRVNRSNKVTVSIRRNVEMVFKVKTRIGKVPISKRGVGKQRRANRKAFQGVKN